MLGNITRRKDEPQKPVKSTRLKDAILEGLGKGRPQVPVQKGDYFRSSSIPRLCPRMYALALKDNLDVGLNPDARLRWVFGVGTACHTQFQEEWLQTIGEVFQGWWRDRATVKRMSESLGGDLSYLWRPRPKGLDCEYVELEFKSDEFRLTGHCDGVLVWDDQDVEILEIKTINSWGFKSVDPITGGKPKVEHVAQVQAYMWMSGLKRARILYVKKDLSVGPDEVMCEHVVERDESIIESIKDMLVECAQVIDGEYVGVPPRLDECRTKSSPRAKYCVAQKHCFDQS